MPTPSNILKANERVSLLINGNMHSDWSSYEIDSDFLTPADGWNVTLGLPDGTFPSGVKKGALTEVKVGNDTVMTGRVDKVTRTAEKKQLSLRISGRDFAAALVDCSVPIFTAKQLSLADVVAKVVQPLGITKIRINATDGGSREKVNIEPGDTAWDTLVQVASLSGLWPWFEPDGTLVIGGPDYSTTPVATLIMRKSGSGNNLIRLTEEESLNDSYSEITVLGQAHGTSVEDGRHSMKSTVTDPDFPFYRPKIEVACDVDSLAQVKFKARKALADARLQALTLNALVKGHRNSDGVLWKPGQRIHVISEPHEIDGVFFMMRRGFYGGIPGGQTTEMQLKEDKVWIPDAYSNALKRSRHRRKEKELQIIDVE